MALCFFVNGVIRLAFEILLVKSFSEVSKSGGIIQNIYDKLLSISLVRGTLIPTKSVVNRFL